jgi:hypothetical protein
MVNWIHSTPHLPQTQKTSLFLFASMAWAVWTRRKKMAIEKIFPSNPSDVIFLQLYYFCRTGQCYTATQAKGEG